MEVIILMALVMLLWVAMVAGAADSRPRGDDEPRRAI